MSWRQPNTIQDFISGYFYYKICKWNFCPRYQQNFNLDLVQNDDFVFLNIDYFEQFLNFLISNNFDKKIVIVTQNSDRDFTQKMFDSIKRFTSKILAINCTVSDPLIKKIPLGFNDHSTEVIEREYWSGKLFSGNLPAKDNLIYLNFKLHHHSDRPYCFDYFKNFDWVSVENGIIPITQFYGKLKSFKYCISPRGTGIDTHRTYESLLYGVIPIVKSSELDDLYSDFPIVLVNDWSDVTYEYLNDNYEENLNRYKIWYSKNPNWFQSSNWIKI